MHKTISHPPVVLIVPGWRDSGPGHWQTLWADALPGAVRTVQEDWEKPERGSWVDSLARQVLAASGRVVIVAHSLGCIATVHLPPRVRQRVCGALFVAPADPTCKPVLRDFAPVPHQRLPYRSIVVSSNDDPYCSVDIAGAYAGAWGSEWVRLNRAGHINVESGHGDWPLGLALLQSLLGVPTSNLLSSALPVPVPPALTFA